MVNHTFLWRVYVNISEIIEKYGFSECAIGLPDKECAVVLGKVNVEDGLVVCSRCGFVLGGADSEEDEPPSIEKDDDDEEGKPTQEVPTDINKPQIKRRTPEERMRINFGERFSKVIDTWRRNNSTESLVYSLNRQRRYVENLYVDLETSSFFPKHSSIIERVIVPIYYTLIYIEKMHVQKKATILIFNKNIHNRLMNRADMVSKRFGGVGRGRVTVYIKSYGKMLGVSDETISDAIFLWEHSEPPYVGRSEDAIAIMWVILYRELTTGVKTPKYKVSEITRIDRRSLSAVEEVYRNYLQSIIEKA